MTTHTGLPTHTLTMCDKLLTAWRSVFSQDCVSPYRQGRCASSAAGWRWASWASWMGWRGLWVLSVGCNLLDVCAVWTQHFPLWTCPGHWSPAGSPSSSLTTLNNRIMKQDNKNGMEKGKRWSTLYHTPCGHCPLISGGVTSGAGVSQGAADFILGRRHAGYKQHVGHRAQTIIWGQATLFLRTSRANRRGCTYACADVHWAPALPPTHLFVSTNPERQTVITVQRGLEVHNFH